MADRILLHAAADQENHPLPLKLEKQIPHIIQAQSHILQQRLDPEAPGEVVELVELRSPLFEPGVVLCVLHGDETGQQQGKIEVASGLELDMQVSFLRQGGAHRIDHHQGLPFDEGHQMGVGHRKVPSPDHHDVGFGDLLGREEPVDSPALTDPGLSGAVTERSVGQGPSHFFHQQIGHLLHHPQISRSSPEEW